MAFKISIRFDLTLAKSKLFLQGDPSRARLEGRTAREGSMSDCHLIAGLRGARSCG